MLSFLPPEITVAGTTILPRRFKLYHYRAVLFLDIADEQEQNDLLASSLPLGNWPYQHAVQSFGRPRPVPGATEPLLRKGSYQGPPAPLPRLAKERCGLHHHQRGERCISVGDC